MAKKFSATPYWLFVIGEWFGELKSELAESTTCWELISRPLVGLSIIRDAEKFEFIGKEANSLWNELYEKYALENANLDSKDIEHLKHTITRWEGRLQEISKNWILSYPDTHIEASKLHDGAKAFLRGEEFNILEPLDQQSLNEAASSLLFANFTSAEFMSLRTAESLLKKWYANKKGQKLGRTTWGQVLEKLSEEYPKEERPKELILLDYLRERRNEIAHPEGISNSLTASTTFLNVISLCESLHLK